MQNNIIIQNILNDICKIIADINKLQEDNFIEDLDYIKLYLEDAVNYKEIQAEKEENYLCFCFPVLRSLSIPHSSKT